MHTLIMPFVTFWQDNWAFIHTFTGMIALASWLAAPPIGGFIAYCQNTARGERSLRGLGLYLFPPEIVQYKAWRLDILHQITKLLFHPLAKLAFLLSVFAVAHGLYDQLSHAAGDRAPRELGTGTWLLITLFFVVIIDAVYFHVHYFQHKFRILWELHSIHHSSERMLLMMSNRRAHPLEELSGGIFNGIANGVAIATVCYALSLDLQEFLTSTGRAYLLLNAMSFYHLRHSHLKLGYGWLERYVISPSQHHVHHAYETHLWDKNFGWLLSVWDRMYGTVVYSRDVAKFPIGLPLAERRNYDTALKLLFVPMVNIARLSWASVAGGVTLTVRTFKRFDTPALSAEQAKVDG